MTKHPSKTIVWKLKSLRSWIYDKWMRWRGYKPLEFDFKNNCYKYMREADLEEFVHEAEEKAPEFEEVHYDTVESAGNMFYSYCDWENLRRKHEKLKELRRNA